MQNQQTLQDIILLYLNNPKDQVLTDQVSHLRTLSDENEDYFQTTKRIWDTAAETKRLEQIDVKESVKNFKIRLNERIIIKPRKRYGWISAAAAILVIAVGSWFYYESVKIDFLVKETTTQIDSVLLSDGTKIILAENSAIRYPDHFSADERPVSLIRGKAFFSVAKDPSRPFEITIKQSTVRVLGTSFNILYSDSTINLSVKTGRVMFTPNKKSTPAYLTAGEGISYNFSSNSLVTQDGHNANSWLTRELHFIDTPLDQVCKQLSDYYGVNIVLHEEMRNGKKFNANFKDITLQEALTVLKGTYSIKIEQNNNVIIIKSL